MAQAWRSRWVAPGLSMPARVLGPAHRIGDELGGDRLAPVGDEQRLAGFAQQTGPRLDQIAVQPGRGARAERDHAILAALALAHEHHQAREVDVVAAQIGQLGAPQAGAVEQFQHRPVAQALRRGGSAAASIASVSATPSSARGKCWAAGAGRGRRPGWRMAPSAASHLNQPRRAHQAAELGADASAARRPACGGRTDGADSVRGSCRDLAGFGQAARVGPDDELAQRDAPRRAPSRRLQPATSSASKCASIERVSGKARAGRASSAPARAAPPARLFEADAAGQHQCAAGAAAKEEAMAGAGLCDPFSFAFAGNSDSGRVAGASP